jgi:hypothetical protein
MGLIPNTNRIPVVFVSSIFWLSVVCCATSVAQPSDQQNPVGPQDKATSVAQPSDQQNPVGPQDKATSVAQPSDQQKPVGPQDKITQTPSQSHAQQGFNVPVAGGILVPAAVLAAVLAGAISGSVTLWTSRKQREQQNLAQAEARSNLRVQLDSSEKNIERQINASRENLEKQIANTQRLKEQEIETNRYSLLMVIGTEAINIKVRTSEYARQIEEEYEDPNEDDLERLRIALSPAFNLNWDEAHLLGNTKLYAHITVLKHTIERATRRIDRILAWTNKGRPEGSLELEMLLKQISALYNECADHCGKIVVSISAVSGSLYAQLKEIADLEDQRPTQTSETTGENAQQSTPVLPQRVIARDTSVSTRRPRAFHSLNETKKPLGDRVYHLTQGCPTSSSIPRAERVMEAGGYRLCEECAKIYPDEVHRRSGASGGTA